MCLLTAIGRRFGIYSIDHSINAGLDLEMPGTNKWRTLDLMNRSIQSRKITKRTVKERARKVLELVQRCAKGAPEVRTLPCVPRQCLTSLQIIDGDGEEHTGDVEQGRDLMTKFASQAIVLLKNEGDILPLKPQVWRLAPYTQT